MKTDFRIMGRPYRGARRVVAMITGIETREAAEKKLEEGVAGGWLDPYAFVRSQRVKDDFQGVDSTADIRAEIEKCRT